MRHQQMLGTAYRRPRFATFTDGKPGDRQTFTGEPLR